MMLACRHGCGYGGTDERCWARGPLGCWPREVGDAPTELDWCGLGGAPFATLSLAHPPVGKEDTRDLKQQQKEHAGHDKDEDAREGIENRLCRAERDHQTVRPRSRILRRGTSPSSQGSKTISQSVTAAAPARSTLVIFLIGCDIVPDLLGLVGQRVRVVLPVEVVLADGSDDVLGHVAPEKGADGDRIILHVAPFGWQRGCLACGQ